MDWIPLTLDAVVSRNVNARPDKEALVFRDKRMTWRELDRWSDELARAFLSQGIKRRQAVATFMANNCEWIAILLALGKIGAVIVPINFRYKAQELAYVLKQSDAVMLIVTAQSGDRDHTRLIIDGCAEAGVERVVAIGDEAVPLSKNTMGWGVFRGSAENVSSDHLARAQSGVNPDDVLIIQYTSGTTAFPKGVQLRQNQMLRSATSMSNRLGMTARDRFFSPMPFFHIGGSTASVLTAMVCGATLCFIDFFAAGEALAILAGERCTHMCGVDTMFVDMLAHETYAGLDLSAIRSGWTIYNEAVFKAFPGMMNVYALSECSSTVAISRCTDPHEQRRDTCGFPLDGVEVRILDAETNEEKPADQPGRIVVRGWCTTTGYYNQSELTAKLYLEDGWLDTGDYGRKLPTGELIYQGRLKDVLRVGGENVASVEVEAVINAHPAVLRSALVPVTHPRLREVPCAFVHLREPGTVSGDEIIEHCRRQLANFKVPRHVIFVDDFAMTGSGKIQKTPLVEQAEAAFGPKSA